MGVCALVCCLAGYCVLRWFVRIRGVLVPFDYCGGYGG